MRRRAVPVGADAGRPPAELLAFDVRDWIDDGDEPALREARARQRHAAACAAWTATAGLPVHRPAPSETWDQYRARVGPPPSAAAAAMRARLVGPTL